MSDLNLDLACSIYLKAGLHLAEHYRAMVHSASENLKPALRWKQACQQRKIQLFILLPHSPKLNEHVERTHRTHVLNEYTAV